MRCVCGFKNIAGAKFCGSCGLALVDGPDSVVRDGPAPSPSTSVPTVGGNVGVRPRSRASMAIVAAAVVVAAAGYWWLNRPPGLYKKDNSGLYPVKVDAKYGFMDRSGKTVITPQFDETGGFSDGLAAVRIGTKFGYINTNGMVVIAPQFDYAGPFRDGRAGVQLCCRPDNPGQNRWGFIDGAGKFVSSPEFGWAGNFSGGLAPVASADRRATLANPSGNSVVAGKFAAYGLANRSGKVVIAGILLTGAFTAGLAPAHSGEKAGYIDRAGKWVIDPQFEEAQSFADGLAPVTVGGRTGYIDQKGQFVVNPQYDFGDEFHEGYARFLTGSTMLQNTRTGGTWGFIDTKGRVVVEAKFLAAGHFSEGLAPVKTEDGWGFVDPTGKMVASPQFDSADPFQNGLAHVTVLGKEAYVTTTGAFVVDPFPGTTARAEKARIAADAAQAALQAKTAMSVNFGVREREAHAIGTLRAINSGQASYSSSCAGGGYATSLTDLVKPPSAGPVGFIVADIMSRAATFGYTITVARDRDVDVKDVWSPAQTCNGSTSQPASGYHASANPVKVGSGRYFATDSRGTLFFSTSGPIGNPIPPGASIVQ